MKPFARWLRRLANRIDPIDPPSKKGPFETMTIRVEADTSQAIACINELESRVRPLIELLDKAKLLQP